MALSINEVVSAANLRGASDIIIGCDTPIKVRIDGTLYNFDDRKLSAEECEKYVNELYGETEPIAKIGEFDIARSFADGIRCRINIFHERGHISAAIRILKKVIPSYDELGLPLSLISLLRLNEDLFSSRVRPAAARAPHLHICSIRSTKIRASISSQWRIPLNILTIL